MLTRQFPMVSVRQASAVPGSPLRATINTSTIGRNGAIVEPRGVQLGAFYANPVLLYQHGLERAVGSWVVGQVLGITPSADRIEARLEFDIDGALYGDQRQKLGAELDRLCRRGLLRAFSIGFIPLEQAGGSGHDDPLRITQWELVELSVVAVGMDAGALLVPSDDAADEPEADELAEGLAAYYGLSPDEPLWSPGAAQ